MKHLLMGLAILAGGAVSQDRPQESSPIDQRIRESIAAFERAHREFETQLLELGPDALPALERMAEQAQGDRRTDFRATIERIKGVRTRIEKLVAELGDESIETRERATAELLKIGRPVRPHLESILAGDNAEAKARAKLLLVVISPQDREKMRWTGIAEAHEKQVALLERQASLGQATNSEVLAARRLWSKARCRAGQITRQDYLKASREILERSVKLAEVNFERGTIERKVLLAIRLDLLLVNRRLGAGGDEQINQMQLQLGEMARWGKERGLLSDSDYLKGLLEALTDPDEDLDR